VSSITCFNLWRAEATGEIRKMGRWMDAHIGNGPLLRFDVGDTTMVQFEPVPGGLSMADYARLILTRVDELEPGWMTCRAQLDINGYPAGGGEQYPLTWYLRQATDWPTGIIRMPEDYAWNGQKITVSRATWIVTVRQMTRSDLSRRGTG
jgi:hypothetical protein